MKKLFKSKTSYDIIALLIDENQKEFYLNEIARLISKDPANVSRELDNLIKEGVVSVKKNKSKKYYSLNSDCPYLKDLVLIFKKQKKSEIEKRFKKDWILAEEIMNVNPLFMTIPFYSFTNHFQSPSGRAYKSMTSVYRGYHLWFYFDKSDCVAVADNLIKKFSEDVSFMEKTNDKIRYYADKLFENVSKIPETGLNKISDKKLWKYHKDHEDLHLDYYRWAWIPPASDMFSNALTDYAKEILRKKRVEKIDEYLSLLTEPEESSWLKDEQDNLNKIAVKVQKDKDQFNIFKDLFRKFKEEDVKNFGLYTHSKEYEDKFEEVVRSLKDKINPEILNDLQAHYSKYFYTRFIYTEEQGVYSFDHYLKELVRTVNSNHNLAEFLRSQEKNNQELIKKKKDLVKKLKLSKDELRFFNAWSGFMITKITRRYAQLFAMYKTTYILEEIARRIGITLKEIRFMRSSEIREALLDGIINEDEIKERVDFCVYYTEKDAEIYYSGTEAKKIFEEYIEKEEAENVTELQGQCGCRGQARGVVRIVNIVSDMPKVKQGDILVSISTQPDLLSAMKRASAFITDQGGVTSHAAIVAREMGTPCIIGTKNATKVLKDGDEVEVDADRGIVKIIKRV